jgi:hypothetical protein
MIASGVFGHRFGLCFLYRARSRRSFHAAGCFRFEGTPQNARCYGLLPVITSLGDDEDVEPTGHYESEYTPDQQEMSDDEPDDMKRVVVEPLKSGIGKAEDDGEDGAREIT